ncbi:peptidase S10, serine carboxypeptidase, Alpha/Beta hydrolase fold protein [Artemisia annua]|uniref:Peptidase S10, serine carboxypeptidase, Alpha/Beta hydrolase fold protein n=1 Tax=Artemisia annua TaxID=35608 RepID=A0A2U1QFL7_ARTAN|nr:peptidase S10, serine carboxypeptidase, Alpha/Beta hydrolase fold protein [Artemisia annua]
MTNHLLKHTIFSSSAATTSSSAATICRNHWVWWFQLSVVLVVDLVVLVVDRGGFGGLFAVSMVVALMNASMINLVTVLCLLATEAVRASYGPLNQGTALLNFRRARYVANVAPVPVSEKFIQQHYLDDGISNNEVKKNVEDDHLLKNGLPGQPENAGIFKQYAGSIIVNESSGRSLFYYFVEASCNSSTKPLILWLNGGPGCSSLGMGAFTEVGPFGVYPDGKTLYARQFSWNRVGNILFIESPVGVGFSYSNTTEDYLSSGDKMTAEDMYNFLRKWFERYPVFKGRDFFMTGEDYAGYYVPELADIILRDLKGSRDSNPMMNLKGIMIGNGLLDDVSDTRGAIDFAWSHALASDETRDEFLQGCASGSRYEDEACSKAYASLLNGIGDINFFNIYSPSCEPAFMNVTGGPCDILYVVSYLNQPEVQVAMNANTTRLPYPWAPCSGQFSQQWKDSPSSVIPIYKRMIDHGLRILLYSGDVDACVPFTSSKYAIAAMDLQIIQPWQEWTMPDVVKPAGYKIVYDGLTYATVRGAGHEVSQSHPDKLYALLNSFLQ